MQLALAKVAIRIVRSPRELTTIFRSGWWWPPVTRVDLRGRRYRCGTSKTPFLLDFATRLTRVIRSKITARCVPSIICDDTLVVSQPSCARVRTFRLALGARWFSYHRSAPPASKFAVGGPSPRLGTRNRIHASLFFVHKSTFSSQQVAQRAHVYITLLQFQRRRVKLHARPALLQHRVIKKALVSSARDHLAQFRRRHRVAAQTRPNIVDRCEKLGIPHTYVGKVFVHDALTARAIQLSK